MEPQKLRLIVGGALGVLLLGGVAYTYWGGGDGGPTKIPEGAGAAQAISEMGRVGNNQNVARVAPYVRHARPDLAVAACLSLGRIGTPEATAQLVPATGDSRPQVAAAAFTALAQVSAPVDPQVAIDTVKDTRQPPEVRSAAIQMLGKRRVWQSIYDLVAALNDPDPQVRGRANAGIEQIMRRRYGFKAMGTQAERDEAVRRIQVDVARMPRSQVMAMPIH